MGCIRIGLPVEDHHIAGQHYGASLDLCLNGYAVITARQYRWPSQLAEIDINGLSENQARAVLGSGEIIQLVWSQACLHTDTRWLRLMLTAPAVLSVTKAFVQEANP